MVIFIISFFGVNFLYVCKHVVAILLHISVLTLVCIFFATYVVNEGIHVTWWSLMTTEELIDCSAVQCVCCSSQAHGSEMELL